MRLDSYFDDFTTRDWQESDPDAGPIRVAHVGLGWWTREEAIPAIEESELCTNSVVVSGSSEKAEAVAAAVDDVEYGLTYREFYDGRGVDAYDAVYVCTPNARHREDVEAAAELGKPVLCEKPMAATVEGARAIVDACDEHDVPLMIAYRMQTEPAVRRVRDLVQDGFLGDIVQVHGHMSATLLDINPDPDQWRLDPELSGGTALADLGIYPLNTTRFVLDADPVGALGRTISNHDAFEDTDEHVAFRVDFPSGAVATCTASHNAFESSHLRVLGSDGEALIEPVFHPWKDRRVTIRCGETTTTTDFEQINQMTEEFDYFADCLLTGREPHPDGEHGLVDMKAIRGVYDAAESRSDVDLD